MANWSSRLGSSSGGSSTSSPSSSLVGLGRFFQRLLAKGHAMRLYEQKWKNSKWAQKPWEPWSNGPTKRRLKMYLTQLGRFNGTVIEVYQSFVIVLGLWAIAHCKIRSLLGLFHWYLTPRLSCNHPKWLALNLFSCILNPQSPASGLWWTSFTSSRVLHLHQRHQNSNLWALAKMHVEWPFPCYTFMPTHLKTDIPFTINCTSWWSYNL